jgi:ATP-dependent Lhr-like helicase
LLQSCYVVSEATLIRRHRQNVGTIPSSASMSIKFMKGATLGHVDESFIGRLRPGDAFVFGGRTLALARVRDGIAYVRLAKSSSRYVPRWQGARLPLSATLGLELLDLLGRYQHSAASEPELVALRPLLDLQSQWSALPTRDRLLVESLENREGFHLFVFPFQGRAVNEGIASLMALRIAREAPRTFSITTNEYGFELLCAEHFPVTVEALRGWLRLEHLLSDLLASVNMSELARRQFRDIARIAGLVDAGTPRRGKTSRQLQASSGLMFDVLEKHDPDNLLLTQARREVLDAQLDHLAITKALQQIAAQSLNLVQPSRFTPLSFPLWADRLQTQTLSTESSQSRIEREARRLEKAAR